MRFAILALAVAAACGPAATRTPAPAPSSAQSSHVAVASPTATPINVDDMMGGSFVPATVFALVRNEIHAVKLQNHFVPYRIPVGGRPHVVVSPDGARFYVADRKDGGTRVRAFDAATGVEMAAARVADEELVDDGAMVQDRPDRVLLLLKAGRGVRVEAVSTSPIVTLGGIYKSPCGDRLLASATRIAIVCSSAGNISIGSLSGTGAVEGPQGGGLISLPGAPIVASTMLADGTIVVGTAAMLHRILSGSSTLVAGPLLPTGSTILGATAADPQRFVVFARSGDQGSASAYDARSGVLAAGPFSVSVRAAHAMALWPFAFFVGERGLWHVDLRSGLTERMVALDDPIPLAVSSR